MVPPIVLLAVCLILTFGGTLSRLFDRLRIGFKGAVTLQFWLIAAVVLPHVAAGSPRAQSALAVSAVSMLVAVAAVYGARVRATGQRFSLRTAVSAIACGGALVGLGAWLTALEAPEGAIQFLLGLFASGLAFALSRDHAAAFFVCVWGALIACAVLFFTPLFLTLGLTASRLAARTVNVTVYGLAGGLLLMNLFKRLRGNYAEDREDSARLGW